MLLELDLWAANTQFSKWSVQKQFLLFALLGLGWQILSYLPRLQLIDMDTLNDHHRLFGCVSIYDALEEHIDCTEIS